MSRVFTSGAESNDTTIEGITNLSGTWTMQSTVKRTGTYAHKMDSGSNAIARIGFQLTTAPVYYARGYYCFANLPDVVTGITYIGTNTASVKAAITSAGKLQLLDNTGSQIGSDSAATITADGTTWYRIELYLNIGTGATDEAELRLDGATVASATGLNITDTSPSGAIFGWVDATAGTSKVLYVDDIAINDNTGSYNNSWPGNGRVLLAVPTVDHGRDALWTGGAGGTTNLYLAVSNLPPLGVASASKTDTTQIIHAGGSTGTDYYVVESAAWSSLGLPGNDIAHDVPGTTPSNAGYVRVGSTGSVMISQPIIARGSISNVTLWLSSSGSSAVHDLIVELRTDSGGSPTSTVLATATVPAASIGTLSGWIKVYTGLAYATVSGTKYHIVLRSPDAIDDSTPDMVAADPRTGTNAYSAQGLPFMNYDGSTWTNDASGSGLFFAAVGSINQVVRLINEITVAGEDIATGTKHLDDGIRFNPSLDYGGGTESNPAWDVAPSNGAVGTYPSNWQVHRFTMETFTDLRLNAETGVHWWVDRPETASRAADVCFMGILVDVQQLSSNYSVSGGISTSSTVAADLSLLYQYMRPSADTITTSWVDENFSATGLYLKVNTVTEDDSTYVHPIVHSGNPPIRFKLSPPAAVPTEPTFTLYVDMAWGRTSTATRPTGYVNLYQGTTQIGSYALIAPPGFSSGIQTLDEISFGPSVTSQITDWNNLYVEVTESYTG